MGHDILDDLFAYRFFRRLQLETESYTAQFTLTWNRRQSNSVMQNHFIRSRKEAGLDRFHDYRIRWPGRGDLSRLIDHANAKKIFQALRSSLVYLRYGSFLNI